MLCHVSFLSQKGFYVKLNIVPKSIGRLVTCSENLSFKNLEGALTILCALTQKRTILFSTILFWVSAQSIVKTPSKFLKLGTHRAGDQPLRRYWCAASLWTSDKSEVFYMIDDRMYFWYLIFFIFFREKVCTIST